MISGVMSRRSLICGPLRASAAAALVVVSGCGGGDSTSPQSAVAPATAPKTQASPAAPHGKFVEQLDALCATGNKLAAAYQKAFAQALAANELAKAGTTLTRFEPIYDRLQTRIEALMPPAPIRRRLRGISCSSGASVAFGKSWPLHFEQAMRTKRCVSQTFSMMLPTRERTWR